MYQLTLAILFGSFLASGTAEGNLTSKSLGGNENFMYYYFSDPFICPESGGDALVAAAKKGNSREVQRLIECPGVDVNHSDRSRMDKAGVLGNHTSLYLASRYGHVEVVNVLLQHPQVDVNYKDFYNRTSLWLASYRGHLKVVMSLLNDNRTDVNIRGGQDSRTGGPVLATPLLAASGEGHVAVVKELISHPQIDINKVERFEGTPLLVASQNGHVEVVKTLLADERVNVNQAGRMGASPLLIASQKGHVDVVKTLLADQRADVNQARKDGTTPLSIASKFGYVDLVRTLLNDQRVNVNQADSKGFTPLYLVSMMASYWGDYEERLKVVKILLADPRVDPNKVTLNDHHAISMATISGNLEAVQLLLRCPKVILGIEDKFGNSELDYAKENNPTVPDELRLQILEAIESRQSLLEQGHTC